MSHQGRGCTVSHVDEVEILRHRNDHLNAEIVDKISEWLRTSTRLASIDSTIEGSSVALREELLAYMREAASEHGLDPDGLERIFAAILDIKETSEAVSR
jgi:chorismate mutase